MTLKQIMDKLAERGGAIVSSNDCSEQEISMARANGDFTVDENGYGFVLRSAKWLEVATNK